MRFVSTLAILIVGAVAQQPGITTCDAQNILEACLASTTARLQTCSPSDWSCMCSAQQAVVTCYNNCPGDPGKSAANSQLTSWCNAASLTATTTTLAVSASSSSGSVAAFTTSSKSASSASSASATNGAVAMYGSGSGLLAAAIGIAALV